MANSLVGSAINQLMALLLLALTFGGFWLNDRFGVPPWLLVVAGIGCVFLVGLLDRTMWRAYARPRGRGLPSWKRKPRQPERIWRGAWRGWLARLLNRPGRE